MPEPGSSSSHTLSYRALDDGHGLSSDASDDDALDAEEVCPNAHLNAPPDTDPRAHLSNVFLQPSSLSPKRSSRLPDPDPNRTPKASLTQTTPSTLGGFGRRGQEPAHT